MVGLPDGTGDTMLKAFVVLQSGQTVTADELKEWCRDPRTGMVAYRVPKVFEFRESLPETVIGKGASTRSSRGGAQEDCDRVNRSPSWEAENINGNEPMRAGDP